MSLAIRHAVRADLPAMLAIYAPYVHNTAISFELEPPSVEEFILRFETLTRQFPWLAAEDAGAVVGYAYASAPFERAAYQWNAELSVYIAPSHQRRGLAAALYRSLETLLFRQGYVRAYGLSTASNTPSLRLHAALGYVEEGRLRRVGCKLGAWHDVVWLGKTLKEADASGLRPPRPWTELDPRECVALFRDESARVRPQKEP